jgi:hypothetical protein
MFNLVEQNSIWKSLSGGDNDILADLGCSLFPRVHKETRVGCWHLRHCEILGTRIKQDSSNQSHHMFFVLMAWYAGSHPPRWHKPLTIFFRGNMFLSTTALTNWGPQVAGFSFNVKVVYVFEKWVKWSMKVMGCEMIRGRQTKIVCAAGSTRSLANSTSSPPSVHEKNLLLAIPACLVRAWVTFGMREKRASKYRQTISDWASAKELQFEAVIRKCRCLASHIPLARHQHVSALSVVCVPLCFT